MNKLLFFLGLCFCLFPLVSRVSVQKHQKNIIATYQENIRKYDADDVTECIKNAVSYNRKIYQINGDIQKENYESQLNLFGNGMMGSIQIPDIDVHLPIYHGTGEEVLSAGVGHLEESSLPVGGTNTHSVLTGHRGLPNSRLFTRLDELKTGDLFFIHIYRRTLAYQVCEIQVTEPENREFMKICEGDDKVSLVTCTPYGINTRRLIVTGKRTVYKKADYNETKTVPPSYREQIFWMLPVGFMLFSITGRRNKKKKRKKHAKLLLVFMMLYVVPVSAKGTEQKGRIEIETLKEVKRYSYSKVGDMNKGVPVLKEEYKNSGVRLDRLDCAKETEKAAYILQKYVDGGSVLCRNQDGKFVIDNLEDGVYLLQALDAGGEVRGMPVLITIPMWEETKKEMEYEITVIPKQTAVPEIPDTGDSVWKIKRMLFCMCFSIICLILMYKMTWKRKRG